MAVYFDHSIQAPGPTSKVLIHHATEWHPSFAILAVASKNETTDSDGCVNFYLEEGELVEEGSIHRSAVVECMQWHPEKKVIAVGWSSGEITTYNNTENKFYEQSSIHRAAISIMRWNKSGSRLITGDKSGLLLVWKVESHGQLHPVPLHQHRLHAPLTHCEILHPISTETTKTGGSVLENFTWERKSAAMLAKSIHDPIACFCATIDGAVFFMNHNGECVERFRLEGPFHSFLLNLDPYQLSIVNHEMLLCQFSVTYDGQTNQTTNAKLSGSNRAGSIITVAEDILASCSFESTIKFWDFKSNENYLLNIQDHNPIALDEVVSCINYCTDKGILAAGTNYGRVLIWKYKELRKRDVEGSERWEFLSASGLAGPLTEIKWGSQQYLLAANSGGTVQILAEHVMNAHFNQQVSIVQVAPNEALAEFHPSGVVQSIQSGLHIKGLYTTDNHVTLWNGKKLEVYVISQDKSTVRDAGSFHTDTTAAALLEHNVYTLDEKQISVRAFQGTVKQILSFSEQEGSPVALSLSGNFLAAGSTGGCVKLWDLTRREAKLHSSKILPEALPESSQIATVQCNSDGSRISIIVEQADTRSKQLVLWDIEMDSAKLFSPAAIINRHKSNTSTTKQSAKQPQESDKEASDADPAYITLPQLSQTTLSDQVDLLKELLGRHPVAHYWDPTESRMLAVEYAAIQGDSNPLRGKLEGWLATLGRTGKHAQAVSVVALMFVTSELHVFVNDIIPIDSTYHNLIGTSTPFLYFSKKSSSGVKLAPSTSQTSGRKNGVQELAGPSTVARETMRDFVGLEQGDADTLQAMLQFSYNSTTGNMDEAFKAIKWIKNESVWENMVRMCVKTQRLDVAARCLGNMGNARAAKAVREAKEIPEPEARLAILAVHLGMLEEAEELYKKSKRYDLLNEFYQLSGQWAKAVEVGELSDRIHIKTTYYKYAKHCEALGEIQTAINCYEKSETHQFEVPKMLLDDPLELENYAMKSKDKGVRKWWAEYLESMGELEQALQFYETANDYYSLVRILCFNGQIARAIEVAEESGCKAAAYHLAKRLSMESGDVKKAIHFYTKAQCYSPAILLAKEHGLDNELMHLALLSSPTDMLDAARYYEESIETLDKAILLYHRSGEISKALELCFQHRQFDALHQIAEDLGEDSSSQTTKKVADYFMEHGQFDKAMEILVKSRKIREALDLCMAHNITLTEDLVERMTIPKKPNETQAETEERVQLLERLAECCLHQNSYHLATKKYTQAGNKTKAMKALLKSGDTEKIVFFAGVSRQKDIYVMAANYLQTLDWRKDPEIMKNIITFYTKGRAMESLAGFYDACAQVEIDEFQDYAKAVGALGEALKCLGKAKTKNPAALEAKVNFFKERIELVKRFAEARKIYEDDPDQCMQLCQGLLDEPNLDTAVRLGDVYGLMIEYYGQTGDYKQAYSLMQEMRQRIPTVNMAYYVDIKTIESIHSALGIPLGRGIGAEVGSGGQRDLEEGSEGEESVGEEVEDTY